MAEYDDATFLYDDSGYVYDGYLTASSWNGVGSFTGDAYRIPYADATLSGIGAATYAAIFTARPDSSLAGIGTVSADGYRIPYADAAFLGVGLTTAASVQIWAVASATGGVGSATFDPTYQIWAAGFDTTGVGSVATDPIFTANYIDAYIPLASQGIVSFEAIKLADGSAAIWGEGFVRCSAEKIYKQVQRIVNVNRTIMRS